jgi:hypothetical protein
MKKSFIEMSREFENKFITYKIKSVLSHWKGIIIGVYALAFIINASAAVGSYSATQHYKERENSIGIIIAPIFANSDTNGLTWDKVLNEVDSINGK